MQMLGPIISTYFSGLYDSLRWATAFHVAVISQRTRKAFRRIIILNAPIFIGSMAVMAAVRTIISRVFFDGDPLEDFQKSESMLSWLLTVLWIAPLYLIAFSFSSVAYNDISTQAYSISQISLPSALPAGTPNTAPLPAGAAAAPPALIRSADPVGGSVWSVVVRNAEEVYRLFVVLTALALVFLLGALCGPLEPIVTLFPTALIYGYYAFEYRWALEGMPTSVRFEILETRWPYFMGFGTILSAITIIFGPQDHARLGAWLASFCTPGRLFNAAEAGTAAAGVGGASILMCPVPITVAREMLAGTFSLFFGTGMFALIFPVFILLATLANPPKTIPSVRRSAHTGGASSAAAAAAAAAAATAAAAANSAAAAGGDAAAAGMGALPLSNGAAGAGAIGAGPAAGAGAGASVGKAGAVVETEEPIIRLPLGAVRSGANIATEGVVKLVLRCFGGEKGEKRSRRGGRRSGRKEAALAQQQQQQQEVAPRT